MKSVGMSWRIPLVGSGAAPLVTVKLKVFPEIEVGAKAVELILAR